MPVTTIDNYVGGEMVGPAGDRWLDVFNPATGDVHARVPDSDADDVEAAVRAAAAAHPTWAATAMDERAAVLQRIADLIERDHELLALAECNDNGKPLSLARSVDIPRAAKNLRFFAAAAVSFASESHQLPDAINYTLRKPIGVVACISPWNLPLYLFTWKIAPAIAAGNCVIGKPSEITPLTAFLFSQRCKEAGLPPGVLNVVHGSGHRTGNALIAHEGIKAVSFTGGTKTGAHIAAEVAPRFKKLSLELGGKNPNVIFADCDYETMLETTLRSSFSNQGQICLCGSRVFVQDKIYDKFTSDFVDRAGQLSVGDPLLESNQLGAVVSEAHRDKITAYVRLAKAEGGTVLCGGETVVPAGRCAGGWFFSPTVIAGLPNDCRTNQEEIFGPVVSLIPFGDEREVVSMANGTAYGLSATVWTRDLTRAHRVADQLEVGVVWINCWLLRDLRTPFGGMKNSGMGREGGYESLRFFTEPKNVCVKF